MKVKEEKKIYKIGRQRKKSTQIKTGETWTERSQET